MKGRIISGFVFVVLSLAVFAGCGPKPIQEPPPSDLRPLTVSILRQIISKYNNEWEKPPLDQLKFWLSDEIVLERSFVDSDLEVRESKVYLYSLNQREPKGILRDDHGIVLNCVANGGRYFLSVNFDNKDRDLQLIFSNMEDRRDEFIYLDYVPMDSKNGDEKGTLYYGPGNQYTLKFGGDRTPYLLINLQEIYNSTTLNR